MDKELIAAVLCCAQKRKNEGTPPKTVFDDYKKFLKLLEEKEKKELSQK